MQEPEGVSEAPQKPSYGWGSSSGSWGNANSGGSWSSGNGNMGEAFGRMKIATPEVPIPNAPIPNNFDRIGR